jgi:aspartate-semialdehyde dehydrogenase
MFNYPDGRLASPIAREFWDTKVVVSTYQAVSGSGRGGVEALENGREDVYPKAIAGNAIPLIGGVGEDGYTTEETKMREESRKILSLPDLPVFATAVRIPVHTGHSESVYVETDRDADLPEVLETLRSAPGVSFSGDASEFPDAPGGGGRARDLCGEGARGGERDLLLVRGRQPAQGRGDERRPDRRIARGVRV